MAVTRKLFCRSITSRISDSGDKNTFVFRMDDLENNNELITLTMVFFDDIPTPWNELLEEMQHNERIEITIRPKDTKQTRLA
jgi:hypothetical protein